MSVVNMAEIASYHAKLGIPDDDVAAMLKSFPPALVDADPERAWDAGRLRRLTAGSGLSLGDRFCLALARREQLPTWTADRKWAEIEQAVGVEVVVIR